jgi:hypothetical protein
MILRKRRESDLQISIINWCRLQYPKILLTISPAGMKLPMQVARRFKAMGYRAGTADILIFEPRGIYHGLTLELKMPGGVPSPEQIEWRNEALDRGYLAVICPKIKDENDCFQWAISTIKNYLELNHLAPFDATPPPIGNDKCASSAGLNNDKGGVC